MHAELLNLSLFLKMLVKCGTMIAALPFTIIIYVGGKLANSRRVPATHRSPKVVSIGKPGPCRANVRRSA